MSIREIVSPFFAARIVSEKRQREARAAAEKARRKAGAPHEIFYFHQPDDPYAVLAAQLLQSLTERFDIKLTPMLVPPPADNDAPEREALVNYSRRDGAMLAQKYGLSFDDPGRQPEGALTALARRILASAIAKERFSEAVCAVDRALWQGDTGRIDALAGEFGMAGEAETAHAMKKRGRDAEAPRALSRRGLLLCGRAILGRGPAASSGNAAACAWRLHGRGTLCAAQTAACAHGWAGR